jgi:predicted Zn finger-like uncharacterized protein
MIIQCKSCARKFVVRDIDVPVTGRNVQCGYCSVIWHQMPVNVKTERVNKKKIKEKPPKIQESLSVDAIKASDGKTYRFLGSQWAVLLPSGKTGLFAKKKIGQELDLMTGRKKIKSSERKGKRISEVNPSSQNIENGETLPDIYKPKEKIEIFKYVFLLIIITFSAVGVLKTFEKDLIYNFPEMIFIFEMLEQQMIYVSEAVKNIIVIIDDLINSY